ncbi:hypothetical protein BDZ91DRAFT_830160 [Kalaharituber pfeilii]|nr:hypothetical protein BDZ91DRAFT_830160 [Kalaharituber pfeilii]
MARRVVSYRTGGKRIANDSLSNGVMWVLGTLVKFLDIAKMVNVVLVFMFLFFVVEELMFLVAAVGEVMPKEELDYQKGNVVQAEGNYATRICEGIVSSTAGYRRIEGGIVVEVHKSSYPYIESRTLRLLAHTKQADSRLIQYWPGIESKLEAS